MRSIISRLFPPRAALGRLETLVLEAVQAELRPAMAVKWAAQVAAVNSIERLPGRRGVHLHRMLRGRPTFDATLAFQGVADDVQIAEVTVTVDGGFTPLRAAVHCRNGVIASIHYRDDSAWLDEVTSRQTFMQVCVECELTGEAATVLGREDRVSTGPT